MKILHVHDAPRILGGASRYLRRLVPAMEARGHTSAVFSVEAPAGLCRQEAGFQYSWPSSSLRRRRDFHQHHEPLARALADFAREVRPHLVHVQNVAAFRSTVFPAIGRLAAPALMTVHDFSLDDPNPAGLPRAGLAGRIKSVLDERSMRRSRRCALQAIDLFLCPTAALQAGLDLPVATSRVLRLPIDQADAAPVPAAPLRLFFAGTLYRSKGVDVLLRGLAAAGGPAAGATLEIAGEGDQRPALESLCAELGLDDRVRFLGPLDDAEMGSAYARSALQVLPSRVAENSPLTILEAGARGRPALASHSGGVPELVDPPMRGWTFPAENAAGLARALEEIAADHEEIARRGTAMREWVRESFAPEAHWDAVHSASSELTGAAER